MNVLKKTLKDKNVILVLTVALVAYISYFSNKLPEVSTFLGTRYGKLIMLALILFTAHHNLPIAILLSIVFLSKVKEDFSNGTVGTSSVPSEKAIDTSGPLAAVGSGIAAFIPFLLLL